MEILQQFAVYCACKVHIQPVIMCIKVITAMRDNIGRQELCECVGFDFGIAATDCPTILLAYVVHRIRAYINGVSGRAACAEYLVRNLC